MLAVVESSSLESSVEESSVPLLPAFALLPVRSWLWF